MPVTYSPLRYPGGKSSIFPMVSDIIAHNGLQRGHYLEPFAGGAGLALSLLFNGVVHEIHLNDIDRAIWCFWDAVVNHSDALIEVIETTPVTMEQWHIQKSVQENQMNHTDLEVGFSLLFLNRTNRSGIVKKAGVIGGKNQDGKYKLDCRFNKNGIIEKIRMIERYKHRIHLSNADALVFLEQKDSEVSGKKFFCIDPPYYVKGSSLYTNFYKHDDHLELSEAISKLESHWILTYDNANEIKSMYQNFRQYNFDLNYSAAIKRKGKEVLVTSKNIKLP
jgi:DNA adenine methylase